MSFLDAIVKLAGGDLTPGFNLPDISATQPAGTYNAFAKNPPQVKAATTTAPSQPAGNVGTWGLGAQGAGATGGSSVGGGTVTPPVDLSLFDANTANLNDLLGRTDTYLNQGLTQNQDQYDTQVGNATTDKNNQVQTQTQDKQSAYDKINQNAGTGYNSLAQIIGRAAGSGSSAFQQLLPDVIGKDTSSKRLDATNNYAQNLSKIDTSFAGVLQDLLNQKKQNEDTLRSGIETQKQNINNSLAQNAQARAQAQGETPAQAVAAAQPFQTAIQNSRDAVDSFFNQFRTPYTTPALAPDVSQYNTDPAAVNAAQSGGDPTDPYGQLLRKKLQGAV